MTELGKAIRFAALFNAYASRVVCFDTQSNRRYIVDAADWLQSRLFPKI